MRRRYSIVSYVLQIKDRHNGNVLIDREGECLSTQSTQGECVSTQSTRR